MDGKWRVGTFPEEVWIVRAPGPALPAGAEPIAPGDAGWHITAWFPEDGPSRRVLAEIHDEVGGGGVRSALDAARLRGGVREALATGVLRAYRLRPQLSGVAVQQEPEGPRTPAPTRDETTWIAIELMTDADPPQPVPYEKFRIELPDHSVREGVLDGHGKARVAGIDPGTCKVSFPRLHGADWDRA